MIRKILRMGAIAALSMVAVAASASVDHVNALEFEVGAALETPNIGLELMAGAIQATPTAVLAHHAPTVSPDRCLGANAQTLTAQAASCDQAKAPAMRVGDGRPLA